MTEQSDLCPELKRAYREAKAQGLPEGWTCRILEHKSGKKRRRWEAPTTDSRRLRRICRSIPDALEVSVKLGLLPPDTKIMRKKLKRTEERTGRDLLQQVAPSTEAFPTQAAEGKGDDGRKEVSVETRPVQTAKVQDKDRLMETTAARTSREPGKNEGEEGEPQTKISLTAAVSSKPSETKPAIQENSKHTSPQAQLVGTHPTLAEEHRYDRRQDTLLETTAAQKAKDRPSETKPTSQKNTKHTPPESQVIDASPALTAEERGGGGNKDAVMGTTPSQTAKGRGDDVRQGNAKHTPPKSRLMDTHLTLARREQGENGRKGFLMQSTPAQTVKEPGEDEQKEDDSPNNSGITTLPLMYYDLKTASKEDTKHASAQSPTKADFLALSHLLTTPKPPYGHNVVGRMVWLRPKRNKEFWVRGRIEKCELLSVCEVKEDGEISHSETTLHFIRCMDNDTTYFKVKIQQIESPDNLIWM